MLFFFWDSCWFQVMDVTTQALWQWLRKKAMIQTWLKSWLCIFSPSNGLWLKSKWLGMSTSRGATSIRYDSNQVTGFLIYDSTCDSGSVPPAHPWLQLSQRICASYTKDLRFKPWHLWRRLGPQNPSLWFWSKFPNRPALCWRQRLNTSFMSKVKFIK